MLNPEYILWFKKKIKLFIEELLHFRVFLYLQKKHGREYYADIKNTGHKLSTIFDIGANIGQSAFHFSIAFPNAKLYCFEPASATFAKLKSNISIINAHCYQIALGATSGQATIYKRECS